MFDRSESEKRRVPPKQYGTSPITAAFNDLFRKIRQETPVDDYWFIVATGVNIPREHHA